MNVMMTDEDDDDDDDDIVGRSYRCREYYQKEKNQEFDNILLKDIEF